MEKDISQEKFSRQENKEDSKSQSDFYTPVELADKIHMSLKFVTTQTQNGRIVGAIKIGRHWRYRKTEINKALLKQQFLREAK